MRNVRILKAAPKQIVYRLPLEALRLTEDIQSLGIAIQLLRSIAPESLSRDDGEAARSILRGCQSLLIQMQRLAQRRLRREFLAKDDLPQNK